MNYEMLDKLLKKKDLKKEQVWKFFGAETQELMEKIIIDNFKLIKIEPDDGFIYISPKNIYENSLNIETNIFYEKLILISFFLRGFAKYEEVAIQGFVRAIGLMKFIFIAEQHLADNPYYKFFINAFKEFKHDKYFREQTDRMIKLFQELTEGIEKVDFSEVTKITEELKNSI